MQRYSNPCTVLLQAHRVPELSGSQISWHSAHESGKVVSSTHQSRLSPGDFHGVLFIVRSWVYPRNIMRPEGLLTYLLTYSMVQSPWAANWLSASQEIPRISRNPKVHYRTHKRPPPFSILGQPNPVHIPTSYLLEIHPNIIHPSTPRSPHWSGRKD